MVSESISHSGVHSPGKWVVVLKIVCILQRQEYLTATGVVSIITNVGALCVKPQKSPVVTVLSLNLSRHK